MSSCSHGMWNDGEDCEICRLDTEEARKLKAAEARIAELERASKAAHQAWVSEGNMAEAMHVLEHVLVFGSTAASENHLWDRTKQVIREAGEDPDVLIARAARNVENWRMGPPPTNVKCDYCLDKGEWQNEFLDWCPCPYGCPAVDTKASESEPEAIHHPECDWAPGEDTNLCSCAGRSHVYRNRAIPDGAWVECCNEPDCIHPGRYVHLKCASHHISSTDKDSIVLDDDAVAANKRRDLLSRVVRDADHALLFGACDCLDARMHELHLETIALRKQLMAQSTSETLATDPWDDPKAVLMKIASHPECPKVIWDMIADALCWARKLDVVPSTAGQEKDKS